MWSRFFAGLASLLALSAMSASAAATDDGWSKLFALQEGCNGVVLDVATLDDYVFVVGDFSMCGPYRAQNFAVWSHADGWLDLGGAGPNASASAIVVHPDASDIRVIVTGSFSHAGGIAAPHIAEWTIDPDWSNPEWASFPDQLSGPTSALSLDLDPAAAHQVFVGGPLLSPGEGEGPRVAVLDWNTREWGPVSGPLPVGVISDVAGTAAESGAGAADELEIWAVGTFEAPGGGEGIAYWAGGGPGAGEWTGVGGASTGGANGPVNTVAVQNGTIYIGGSFTSVASEPIQGIAQWNGQWSSLGTGIDYFVNDIHAPAGQDVYVTGSFRTAGGLPADRVAAWNPVDEAWYPLGVGLNSSGQAISHSAHLDRVLVGGTFQRSGSQALSYVGSIDLASQSALPLEHPTAGLMGVSGDVHALSRNESTVFAGGLFGNQSGSHVGGLIQWPVGQPHLSESVGGGVQGAVYALLPGNDGSLFVGGMFNTVGNAGVLASGIAHWDGTSWAPLGEGIVGTIRAFLADGHGGFYVGGTFSGAGGLSNIAHWDGQEWSSVGQGTNGTVFALANGPNGTLVAGGQFTQAGGQAASRIAKWDGGMWSPLGNGVGNSVLALASGPSGAVYVGGTFGNIAGTPATNNLAAYYDGNWHSVGALSFGGVVEDIVVDEKGSITVAGRFSSINGQSVPGVATRYHGQWLPMGSGLAGRGHVIDTYKRQVIVGGRFGSAGLHPASNLSIYQFDGLHADRFEDISIQIP